MPGPVSSCLFRVPGSGRRNSSSELRDIDMSPAVPQRSECQARPHSPTLIITTSYFWTCLSRDVSCFLNLLLPWYLTLGFCLFSYLVKSLHTKCSLLKLWVCFLSRLDPEQHRVPRDLVPLSLPVAAHTALLLHPCSSATPARRPSLGNSSLPPGL